MQFRLSSERKDNSFRAPRVILIHARFVHQHDEEMSVLKKERRPGRPASTREDILRIKIAADEREHRDGFCGCLLLSFSLSSANILQTCLISRMRTMWCIWTGGMAHGRTCLLSNGSGCSLMERSKHQNFHRRDKHRYFTLRWRSGHHRRPDIPKEFCNVCAMPIPLMRLEMLYMIAFVCTSGGLDCS
jgi:hypothetical protein